MLKRAEIYLFDDVSQSYITRKCTWSTKCEKFALVLHTRYVNIMETLLLGPVEAGVEDACKSLVCENGAITSSRPATCTNIELRCVDPQLGEDCCPYCPNGRSLHQ